MKTSTTTTAVLLTVPTLLLAAAPAAHAAHAAHAARAGDDDRQRSGACSSGTTWKLKAGPDDGRLEVEAEIDSNRSGQTWQWVLRHDGAVVDRGASTTRGRSGSFEVERRTPDGAGTDTFRFRAVDPASGEVCVGRVTR